MIEYYRLCKFNCKSCKFKKVWWSFWIPSDERGQREYCYNSGRSYEEDIDYAFPHF